MTEPSIETGSSELTTADIHMLERAMKGGAQEFSYDEAGDDEAADVPH